jgi:hypothetical protein
MDPSSQASTPFSHLHSPPCLVVVVVVVGEVAAMVVAVAEAFGYLHCRQHQGISGRKAECDARHFSLNASAAR